MPKDRKDRSLSSRASPYPCTSRRNLRSSSKSPLEPVEDVKEWEEARCPVCMEHPHNAVLLLCSSHEKGCRPYMCDTSYRHSNCLDQFRKASGETPPTSPEEVPQATAAPPAFVTSEEIVDPQPERSNEGDPPAPTLPCENHVPGKLSCPLCRGQVNGWIVVEPARQFMNDKSRSCACETCDFNGNYADLRKHARLKHPLVRPSDADPQRQQNWRLLERERDIGDVLSTIQSAFGDERADDGLLIPTNGGLLSVLIFFRVSRSALTESGSSGSSSNSSSSIWSSPSRSRGQTRSRRRTVAAVWGRNHEAETGSNTRDGENGSSEGATTTGPWHLRERNRRWPTSDDES